MENEERKLNQSCPIGRSQESEPDKHYCGDYNLQKHGCSWNTPAYDGCPIYKKKVEMIGLCEIAGRVIKNSH